MGRKIAGRKHRGIRDPEKQQATRLAALAQKINCPPKDNDEQAIPKSLVRIQKLQTKMLNTEANPIRRHKGKYDKRDNFGIFKRGKGETDKRFLYRVHKRTEELCKEAQFSDKYNVDIIRNKESDEVERLQKRDKDELQEYLTEMKKDNWKKKTKRELQRDNEPKLTKSQKKRQKVLAKKQKHLDKGSQTNNKQVDEVAFGEVCHTPPTLTLPRIRANSQQQNNVSMQAGRRNLLLKSVLSPNNNMEGVIQEHKPAVKNFRPRDLPALLRDKMESNQKAAIEAYKQLKAAKFKSCQIQNIQIKYPDEKRQIKSAGCFE